MTLRIRGDASLDELAPPGECPDRSDLTCDLRWLASAGLLRRASGAGTWDVADPAATYQLSRPGQALADSLAALTRACERLGSRHAPRD
nr:hypothetical protein [Micromonospora purpureochromogenes]